MNSNTKTIVLAGLGAVAVGVGLYALYRINNPHEEKPHEDKTHDMLGMPVSEKVHQAEIKGKVTDLTEEEEKIMDRMKKQYKEKIAVEGAHLDASFFSDLFDLVYLRTNARISHRKEAESTSIIFNHRNFRFSDYSKKVSLLAQEISEIEDQEIAKLLHSFEDSKFVLGSKVYLIRYDPDEILMQLVTGSSLKNKANLKVINHFSLKPILEFLTKKIVSRIEQGVQSVDSVVFPTEFRLQMEMELLSKHDAKLDEVIAFCTQEELHEAESAAWTQFAASYLKLLKLFHHSLPLYTPGIRVMDVQPNAS